MALKYYPLEDILAVASVHPFYSDSEYPPTSEELADTITAAKKSKQTDLRQTPLVRKEQLYQAIQRLSSDDNPRNGYRERAYTSITGGGSGGVPMVFVTDSVENRQQRLVIGSLMKRCGLLEQTDWVLTMHISGYFYRALDLISELVEHAGAGSFSAGHSMSYEDVVNAIIKYRINVVAGDGSQVVQIAAYIATLPSAEREKIKLTKILYTSEPLIRSQRAFIRSVLGPVTICSVMGSSEAGPWALANLDLTGDTEDDYTDFIYDTRTMLIEILPLSVEDPSSATASGLNVDHLPEGQAGIVVQTSLQRLRHPLVRYVSGDLGSLLPLPPTALAKIPAEEAQYLKVLRLYGRDRRFSFKWFAAYFGFPEVDAFMRTEEYGIMQWQVILRYTEGTPEVSLEVRVFRPEKNETKTETVAEPEPGAVNSNGNGGGSHDNNNLVSREDLVADIGKFFGLLPINEHLFRVTLVRDTTQFERSQTGNKVMRFVDHTKK